MPFTHENKTPEPLKLINMKLSEPSSLLKCLKLTKISAKVFHKKYL